MEKTLSAEAEPQQTAIRTKPICLWLDWQITHGGAGLVPSERQGRRDYIQLAEHVDTRTLLLVLSLMVQTGKRLCTLQLPFWPHASLPLEVQAWKDGISHLGSHIPVWSKEVTRIHVRAERCDLGSSPSSFCKDVLWAYLNWDWCGKYSVLRLWIVCSLFLWTLGFSCAWQNSRGLIWPLTCEVWKSDTDKSRKTRSALSRASYRCHHAGKRMRK